MIEKVSTLDIRGRLGGILNRVALRHDEFIIERKGKALAAMVSVEKLRQLQEVARLHLLDALRFAQSSLSDDEVEALADEAKHQARPRKTE